MAALASEPSARQLAVLVAAASRGAAQGASQSVENTEGLGIVAELEEYLSILKVQSVAQVAGQLRQRGRAGLASRLRKVAAGRHPIAHPDVLLKACLLEITDSATSTMEGEPAQGIEGFDNMETTLGMALEESGGKPPKNKKKRTNPRHNTGWARSLPTVPRTLPRSLVPQHSPPMTPRPTARSATGSASMSSWARRTGPLTGPAQRPCARSTSASRRRSASLLWMAEEWRSSTSAR